MELKNCSTVLFVKDIATSKKFYTTVLGMSVSLDFGKNVIFNNGIVIWEIKKDHVIPASLGIDRISDYGANRFELYFETDHLSDIYEILKSEKIRFLHEVRVEPWGQQTIRFFDPDNHLIEIGESMNQFVSRFYNQGLTIEQVSERTSVPVEEVRRLLNIH